MPPFITGPDGRTGYYMNGQFVAADQSQYDSVFSQQMPNMQNNMGVNPYQPQVPMQNWQKTVQQGTLQAPVTNEQKIGVQQGDTVPLDTNATNLRFGQHPQGLGFTNPNGQFFESNAMSASGHPMIKGQGVTNPIWDYTGQGANNMQRTQQGVSDNANPYSGQPAGGIGSIVSGFGSIMGSNGGASIGSSGAGAGTAGTIGAGAGLGAGAGAGLGNAAGAAGNNLGSSKEVASNNPFGDMSKLQKSQLIGTGIGTVAKVIGAAAPGNYDERVGMTKPNAVGTIAGDATFTQIGSSFGLPGMAAGATIDLVKNIVKYAKQKDKFQNKEIGVNTMTAMNDQRDGMKTDFTGYARFGTEVTNPYLKKK